MNVVLKDVEEQYTVRVRVKRVILPLALQGGDKIEEDRGGREGGMTDNKGASASTPSREGGTAGGEQRRPRGRDVSFRPSSTSAADDPVEPGEIGLVSVPVEKVS